MSTNHQLFGTMLRMSKRHSSSTRPSDPVRIGGRYWVGLLVAAFLVFQLLTPLRYYLNAPTPDERFAWRMFSTQHMTRCHATLHQVLDVDGRQFEEVVPPMVVAPWQRMLNRNRPDVVRQVMRQLSERPNVIAVRFTLDCRNVEGEEMPLQAWLLDARTGETRQIEAPQP